MVKLISPDTTTEPDALKMPVVGPESALLVILGGFSDPVLLF
jgi:hypothetical protein